MSMRSRIIRRAMRRRSVCGLYSLNSIPASFRSNCKMRSNCSSSPAASSSFKPADTGNLELVADAHELNGDVGRIENAIDMVGGNRVARHAAVLGGFGALDNRDAAFALDRLQSRGAVGVGAGEHDTDGMIFCSEATDRKKVSIAILRRGAGGRAEVWNRPSFRVTFVFGSRT